VQSVVGGLYRNHISMGLLGESEGGVFFPVGVVGGGQIYTTLQHFSSPLSRKKNSFRPQFPWFAVSVGVQSVGGRVYIVEVPSLYTRALVSDSEYNIVEIPSVYIAAYSRVYRTAAIRVG
jgi:hypothetical protein